MLGPDAIAASRKDAVRIGGVAGARWGRLLAPGALRGVVVVVGLIAIVRLV